MGCVNKNTNNLCQTLLTRLVVCVNEWHTSALRKCKELKFRIRLCIYACAHCGLRTRAGCCVLEFSDIGNIET